jgi:heme/copper-type cytochrome/quinol oxidase subunit 2
MKDVFLLTVEKIKAYAVNWNNKPWKHPTRVEILLWVLTTLMIIAIQLDHPMC